MNTQGTASWIDDPVTGTAQHAMLDKNSPASFGFGRNAMQFKYVSKFLAFYKSNFERIQFQIQQTHRWLL